MLLRNVAIAGILLVAALLAALVAVEMLFAEKVIYAGARMASSASAGEWAAIAALSSRQKDAFAVLSLFSLAALAAAAALTVAAAQKPPLQHTPGIIKKNFEKQGRAHGEILMRYQCLLGITPAALMEIDSSGNIVPLNGPARRLTGHEENLTQGRPFAQFIPVENRAEIECLLNEIWQGNTVKNRELPFVRADGAVARLIMGGAPLLNDGKVMGILITAHDPGTTETLARELEDARREAGETTEQLKKTIREIEEFALLAVKREVKMQEIRERLKKIDEERGDKKGLML